RLGHSSLSAPPSTASSRPQSPRFPYTTLFRSQGPFGLRVGELRLGSSADIGLELVVEGITGAIPNVTDDSRRARRESSVTFGMADRKSTRLNSSHEWISYAVFCLKKKNENDCY